MCDPVSATIAATAIATTATTSIIQRNAQKKAENNQKAAIAEQTRRDNATAEAAKKIGPAARKFDEVDAQSEEEIKKRQLMLQNGIMGTMTNSPGLATQAPAGTEIKKATLGA